MKRSRICLGLLSAAALLLSIASPGLAQRASTAPRQQTRSSAGGPVVARVDGEPITQADIEWMLKSRRVPERLWDKLQEPFLEQLIDMRLIQKFLAARRIQANEKELEEQVARIRRTLARGEDAEKTLAELGYDEASLREELALPLAWQSYLALTVNDEQIRDFYQKRKAEFDGTQVRASQILLKVSPEDPPAKLEAAKQRMAGLRADILAKRISFAEAARMYSEAPSAENDGDVGYFPRRGKMPEDLSRHAFALEVGELSEPFTSPYGVHLVLVTDRKPGDLSLEDARGEVLNQLSHEIWEKTVRDLRSRARIERANAS